MRCRSVLATATTMVVLSSLALAGVAEAQHVRGWVTDGVTEQPLAGARLIFSRSDQGGKSFTVRTDADGFYEVTDMAEAIGGCERDSALVHVIARGYLAAEIQLPCDSGALDRHFALAKQETSIRREFIIRYRGLEEIYEAIRPHASGDVIVSEPRNALIVDEKAEDLERIAEIIGQHDVPPKQIWLEVILVLATGDGDESPRFPEELAPVVDQLGSLFRFTEYRVVGRANAMAMEGASMVISSNEGDSSDYEFEAACRDIGYFDEIVRLGELSIAIQEPVARYLNASVNVRDGDIAILGASHGDPRQGSLITVVTARVVD